MCQPHTNIVTIVDLGADADECNARRNEARQWRPECCQGCGATTIIGHGWYPRFAACLDCDIGLWVRRWLCTGCHKTISQLPGFLHRHRHYTLAVIGSVLHGRLEAGAPWRQLGPSVRSARRWVAAFLTRMLAWLVALLRALATVLPLLSLLDPHGAAQDAAIDPAHGVLTLGRKLADWLAPDCADWLRTLWQWGWNTGVGRLV